MQQAKHYFISGRVQGVFFRAATQKKAIELKITGWVKNTNDNRVEVLAFGTDEQLDELEKWLWHGPPSAQVTDVQITTTNHEPHTSFKVLR